MFIFLVFDSSYYCLSFFMNFLKCSLWHRGKKIVIMWKKNKPKVSNDVVLWKINTNQKAETSSSPTKNPR